MLLKRNRKLRVKRKPNTIVGDTSRVITSPHFPGSSRRTNLIVKRVCGLSKGESKKLLKNIMTAFSWRHEDLTSIFDRHFNLIEGSIDKEIVLSDTQKSLIGAYFTKEYAIESAALFNPSIVPHPIQAHLEKGSLRFVMSLRATGEGHISSIVFRSGVLNRYNTFRFDPVSEFVETPVLKVNPSYKRKIFQHKLKEMNADNDICSYILNELPEVFSKQQLIE